MLGSDLRASKESIVAPPVWPSATLPVTAGVLPPLTPAEVSSGACDVPGWARTSRLIAPVLRTVIGPHLTVALRDAIRPKLGKTTLVEPNGSTDMPLTSNGLVVSHTSIGALGSPPSLIHWSTIGRSFWGSWLREV